MKINNNSINKLMAIMLMLIMTVINTVFSYNALKYKFSLNAINQRPSNAVMILAILGIITLIIVIYTWKIVQREIISPYTILFLTMYLYSYGQSICWVLGISDFYKDLVLRESQYFLVQSQAYTLLFLSVFHIGALIVSGNRLDKYAKYNKFTKCDNNALFKTGIFFLIVSSPAFLINIYTSINLVINYGYGGIYYHRPDYSKFIDILLYLGKYFEPSLICILISKYQNKKIRRIVIFILSINMLTYLYIGGRSGIVVVVLCILCIWHYLIKPINIKRGLAVGGLAYVFAGILNTVAMVRGQSGRNLIMIFNTFFSTGKDIIGNFVGEIGWSLTSVGYTMRFVPTFEPFRNGSTYLYGLSTIIPNLGFWNVHPATVNAQLSTWLQNMLGIEFGPGYTIVAETYINFGWYGILFAALEGVIIGWILSKTNKRIAKYNLSTMTFVIIFLLVGLQPLIRSSFVVAFRDFAYILGGMYLVYIYMRNNYRKLN